MMKRILAFLLSAMLLCLFAVPGAAEGNFYWDAADKLCGRMFVLALDPQYLGYMLGKDVTETSALASMQALAGKKPFQRQFYRFKGSEGNLGALLGQSETATPNPVITDELLLRLNGALPDYLNGYIGGTDWLALSSCLTVSETFLMPENFQPGTLALLYDGCDAAVMVTFTQTGEETITATAKMIPAKALDEQEILLYINLLWERVE